MVTIFIKTCSYLFQCFSFPTLLLPWLSFGLFSNSYLTNNLLDNTLAFWKFLLHNWDYHYLRELEILIQNYNTKNGMVKKRKQQVWILLLSILAVTGSSLKKKNLQGKLCKHRDIHLQKERSEWRGREGKITKEEKEINLQNEGND